MKKTWFRVVLDALKREWFLVVVLLVIAILIALFEWLF
jgi:hypothetical protein